MYRIRLRIFNLLETAPEWRNVYVASKCSSCNEQRARSLNTRKQEKFEDTFGLLSDVQKESGAVRWLDEKETDDGYKGLRNSIQAIKGFIRDNKYEKAVAELKEIEKRRKAPQSIYRLLISYKAVQGDAKEAFHMYNELKRRGYRVDKAVYTSLFKACRNCSRGDVALPIADKVLKYVMENESMQPNIANYNAILKAYGRHGDLKTYLNVFDVASSKFNGKLPVKTYNCMLQGCLSDRNSGLRFALLIWHKMLRRSVKPDLYTFGCLLHCVQECSVGDVRVLQELVNEILRIRNQFRSKTVLSAGAALESVATSASKDGQIEEPVRGGEERGGEEAPGSDVAVQRIPTFANLRSPNLLDVETVSEAVIGTADFSKPENRLSLLGGVDGLLKTMSKLSVKPDVKFFTLLLGCVSPTTEAETEVISLLRRHNIKADTAFYNMLLKRRIIRGEEASIEDYLNFLTENKVKANTLTFGILAMSCSRRESGMKCIEKVRENGLRLNSVILGTLLRKAGQVRDMKYVSELLTAAKEDQVELNVMFIAELKRIVEREKDEEKKDGESLPR